jgi:hypothetical protein
MPTRDRQSSREKMIFWYGDVAPDSEPINYIVKRLERAEVDVALDGEPINYVRSRR